MQTKMKPTERFILCALKLKSPISVPELVEMTGAAPETIREAASSLARQGFVRKEYAGRTVRYFAVPEVAQ